jgi:hypothetical protein
MEQLQAHDYEHYGGENIARCYLPCLMHEL